MNVLFHGQHYYTETSEGNWRKIFDFIHHTKDLQKETTFSTFPYVNVNGEIKIVIFSDCPCGRLTGNALSEWESVKRYAYKLKRGPD